MKDFGNYSKGSEYYTNMSACYLYSTFRHITTSIGHCFLSWEVFLLSQWGLERVTDHASHTRHPSFRAVKVLKPLNALKQKMMHRSTCIWRRVPPTLS